MDETHREAGCDFGVVVHQLVENEGTVYLGAKPDSLGFVLDGPTVKPLLETEKNRGVIRPYYSGSDLNDSPNLAPPRWIIDFSCHSLDEAGGYPELLAIVEREVKPKRLTLKRQAYRDRWWQFTEPQLALFNAIRKRRVALAVSRVSKHFVFRIVPSASAYSDKVVVFVRDSLEDFAVLSSDIHLSWAIEMSGTHGSGTAEYKNYKPTECGRTFPFPHLHGDMRGMVAQCGNQLNSAREELFRRMQVGPTVIYNRLHDSADRDDDIQKLRGLHVEMDRAVAAAYGWGDLDLCHGFHDTKQGLRFTISEAARREVLARLLRLNHERYAEEVRQGLHEKRKPTAAKKPRKATANTDESGGLFQ